MGGAALSISGPGTGRLIRLCRLIERRTGLPGLGVSGELNVDEDGDEIPFSPRACTRWPYCCDAAGCCSCLLPSLTLGSVPVRKYLA